MKKLYYIENVGCDDITRGIAEFDDEELESFLTVIRNLNKNSRYGCMPTIGVREISWSMVSEYINDHDCDYEKMYYNGKVYSLNDFDYRYTGPNLV